MLHPHLLFFPSYSLLHLTHVHTHSLPLFVSDSPFPTTMLKSETVIHASLVNAHPGTEADLWCNHGDIIRPLHIEGSWWACLFPARLSHFAIASQSWTHTVYSCDVELGNKWGFNVSHKSNLGNLFVRYCIHFIELVPSLKWTSLPY